MVEETARPDQKVQHEAALSCNGSAERHRGKGVIAGENQEGTNLMDDQDHLPPAITAPSYPHYP
jgi:hypothetical protein